MPALFSLGQTVATPGALEALEEAGQTPHEFLTRHLSGDWGDRAGARCAQELLGVLAPHRAVRWIKLGANKQPADYDPDQIVSMIDSNT